MEKSGMCDNISGPNIIRLYYHPDENIFTYQDGEPVHNIFDILTPNDILMYKSEAQYSLFEINQDPYIICEILDIDECEGDVYFNQEKGVYDGQIYFTPDFSVSCGGNCGFSSESEDVRREVCAACGGRT